MLIDMELGGLFDLWFQLGIETHTTDLIRNELEAGGHEQALAYFTSGQIREHGLGFEELAEVAALEAEVGSKARFNDCSVLLLARRLDAMLLSSDKALRKAAEARAVEVHGTLWIMDRLVEARVLAPKVAASKLAHLLSLERYFPKAECHARMKQWGAVARAD